MIGNLFIKDNFYFFLLLISLPHICNVVDQQKTQFPILRVVLSVEFYI